MSRQKRKTMIEKEQDFLEEVNFNFFNPLPRIPIDIDLVKYEVGTHRLFEILEAGRYALQRISGSTIVTEAGESLFSVFDPEGNCVLTASGITLHIMGVESAIKVILAWYKDAPGIYPGDQFFYNDPYVTGNHAADEAIVKPIFYKDKLVAWVGSLTHTTETGAIEPGGMPATATEVFHEGFRLQGVKIVNRGVLDKAVLKTLERATRDPRIINLDTRAKVAGNNTSEKYLLEMFNDFGVEFIHKLFRKMIYETEDRCRARLKAIPDGIWRSKIYGDSDGTKDTLLVMKLKATKKDDNLLLDFTGTSPQSPGPENCCLPGTLGNIFTVCANLLFWDTYWNRGMAHPIDVKIPKGSIIRPVWPGACNQCPPTVGTWVEAIFSDIVCRMHRAAGEKFEDDINAPWRAVGNGIYLGGLDQYGIPYGAMMMDTLAGGTGAGARRDGCDSGNIMYAPWSVIPDVETMETKYPMLYLMRNERIGSCGHGKFRGGVGARSIIMIHNADSAVAGLCGLGKYTLMTPGVFGGYPADCCNSLYIFNPQLKEKYFKYSKTITYEDLKNFEGYLEESAIVAAKPMKEGDIVGYEWPGGGGYGDPLQRDIELVHRDLMDGKITPKEAEKIYGVVVDPETRRIDKKVTKQLRTEILEERKKSWRYRR